MSETLERACRAICQSHKFETGEGTCALICMDQLGCARDNCTHVDLIHGDLARCIISALREPDDETCNAPLKAMPEHANWLNARASFFVWQAMIDKILTPTE